MSIHGQAAAPQNDGFVPAIHFQTGGRGTTFNVLVLDDSSFDQARIRRACSETGLPVTTTVASDIDEFASRLDDATYDMVLVDYMLPRGDGLEAQRLVQNHPRNFGAAIVMISSDMQAEVAVASMKKGSLDCLDKDALDSDKLRELLMTSAKAFAEASRHWIGELLSRQRAEIARDVARVVRDEMGYGKFIDTIDKRILEALEVRGITEPPDLDGAAYLDADEPFRFR